MDDDEFLPRHDYYAKPPQQRYRRPLGTTTRDYGARPTTTTESPYFNGQNFGILVAFFVIYIFHKAGFGRGLSERSVTDWVLEAQEYALAYGQMALELCRKLRCYLLAGGEDWFLHDMPTSPNGTAGLHGNGPRGRRRNMAAPAGGRIASSRMPELEETDINPLEVVVGDPWQQQTAFAMNKENTDPVPPAFLRDEDYPPGWLVFDPVLGVVSKTEADNYRKKQQKQAKNKSLKQNKSRQLKLPQQQQQSVKSPTTLRDAKQQAKQQMSPSQKYAKKTPTRPLRTNNNVMPSMHTTPQTIAANG